VLSKSHIISPLPCLHPSHHGRRKVYFFSLYHHNTTTIITAERAHDTHAESARLNDFRQLVLFSDARNWGGAFSTVVWRSARRISGLL
jgi:hypothetical protein